MNFLKEIARFPQTWGNRTVRLVIFILFVLVLTVNSMVLNQQVSQDDADFEQVSEQMYTGLGVITCIIVGLTLFTVFYMGKTSTGFGYSEGIQLIFFVGLVIWALIPEILLFYSRPGCSVSNLEGVIRTNAAISVAISSIMIVWFILSVILSPRVPLLSSNPTPTTTPTHKPFNPV